MSIFNSSFPETIQNELYARQNNLFKRNNINSLVQPTAWIRMTSGVNTLKPDSLKSPVVDNEGNQILDENGEVILEYKDSDFDNNLAKNNVITNILGGNENPQGSFLKGYSLENRHGIRPLPGITSLDCQSFSPNGSLRKVSIKFNCWDNSQLEIMEQLYLRPGYLICVEWGWSQELSTGKKVILPNFGNKFLENKEFHNKTLMELYEIANEEVQSVNGNYDICIGKVQNFNWKLRKDNGYDCDVTIITFGEILDSWKINNIDTDIIISKTGLPLDNSINNLDEAGISKYAEGKLVGILNDLNNYALKYFKTNTYGTDLLNKSIAFKIQLPNISNNINMFVCNFDNDVINSDKIKLSKDNSSHLNSYITLGSLCDILNYYVLNTNILKLSTTYKNNPLMCQTHPFQLPCNPSVCLIKPQGWIDGLVYNQSKDEIQKTESGIKPSNDKINIVKNIFNKENKIQFTSFLDLLESELKNNNLETALSNIQYYMEFFINIENSKSNTDGTLNLIFNDSYIYKNELDNNKQAINLYKFLKLNEGIKISGTYSNLIGFEAIINKKINVDFEHEKFAYPNIIKAITNKDYSSEFRKQDILGIDINTDPITYSLLENSLINKLRPFNPNTTQAFQPIDLKSISETLNNRFKNLEPFFIEPAKNNYRKGNISNIYLNLDFLYSLIKPNDNIDDKNNKNEISLTSFIKDILNKVQNSIGSFNQFEIFADPIDNIAKIIDKDFVDSKEVKNIFLFDVDYNKSFIINHDIKSQIFPEQSTMVAIATQASSSKLGLKTTGLVKYNETTRNRFVELNSPNDIININNLNVNKIDVNNPFYLAISQLALYTSLLKLNDDNIAVNNVNISALNNLLRDLIIYWDNKHPKEAYKSTPLPIIIGLEFPGIAGIRIGNIFNVEGGPKNILPASFVEGNLDFLIRNISHNINNNIWTSRIEGYPFNK